MKIVFKFLVWVILVIALLFISLVFLFTYTGFSQASNSTSNLEKLQLTFPVGFSEKEKKFINSLTQTDLEKLIRVIKLIVERNTASASNTNNSKINSFFSSQQSSPRQQPTTYSNNPSPQTPHYNQETGQYQSTTPSSGSGSGSSIGQQNPYSNNLPFSGQPTPPASPLQQQSTLPQTPLGALMQGLSQGLEKGVSNEANCNGQDSNGNGTDAEIRMLAKASGIGIGSVSTLEGLPKKTILALKQIKTECSCDVTITGGTSTTQHKTHGPGKAIVDIRSRDNPALRAYIKSGRLPKGVTYLDETETGIQSSYWTAPHWHIVANNYACSK